MTQLIADLTRLKRLYADLGFTDHVLPELIDFDLMSVCALLVLERMNVQRVILRLHRDSVTPGSPMVTGVLQLIAIDIYEQYTPDRIAASAWRLIKQQSHA